MQNRCCKQNIIRPIDYMKDIFHLLNAEYSYMQYLLSCWTFTRLVSVSLWLAVWSLVEICRDLTEIGPDMISTNHITENRSSYDYNWLRSSYNYIATNHTKVAICL